MANSRKRFNSIEEFKAHRAKYLKSYRSMPGKQKRATQKIREWRKNNSEKYKAHNLVNNSIRLGKLERPQECQHCGESKPVHAHHDDYSKPLDVLWLCSTCHVNRHVERRKNS